MIYKDIKLLCKQLGWEHQESGWINGYHHGSRDAEELRNQIAVLSYRSPSELMSENQDLKDQVKQLKNTLIEILKNNERKSSIELIEMEKVK